MPQRNTVQTHHKAAVRELALVPVGEGAPLVPLRQTVACVQESGKKSFQICKAVAAGCALANQGVRSGNLEVMKDPKAVCDHVLVHGSLVWRDQPTSLAERLGVGRWVLSSAKRCLSSVAVSVLFVFFNPYE